MLLTNQLVRVGRWMCQTELGAMIATGLVQISTGTGSTNVLFPSDPSGYKNPSKADRYVEFDIEKKFLHAWTRNPPPNWAKIYPPGSSMGNCLGVTQMPAFQNLVICI